MFVFFRNFCRFSNCLGVKSDGVGALGWEGGLDRVDCNTGALFFFVFGNVIDDSDETGGSRGVAVFFGSADESDRDVLLESKLFPNVTAVFPSLNPVE